MNKVIGRRSALIGNVGGTPEVRTLGGDHSQNGVKVANFSIATTERYTDKNSNKVEQTEWHRLEVWNGLAKVAETIIKTGDRLCIEGKIKTEKWEDKDGNPKSTVKIRVERIESSGVPLLGNRREQVEQEGEKAQAKETKKGKPSEAKKAETSFVATTGEGDLPF